MPKAKLASQIETQITRLKKENPDLDKAFNAVTKQLLKNGVKWNKASQQAAEQAAQDAKANIGPVSAE
jgi:hypothetical protein